MEFQWVNLFATKFQVSVTTHFNYNMDNFIEGLWINQCDTVDQGFTPSYMRDIKIQNSNFLPYFKYFFSRKCVVQLNEIFLQIPRHYQWPRKYPLRISLLFNDSSNGKLSALFMLIYPSPAARFIGTCTLEFMIHFEFWWYGSSNIRVYLIIFIFMN